MTADEMHVAGNMWVEFQASRLDRMNLDHEWWVASERYEGNTRVFYERISAAEGQVYEVVSRRPRYKTIAPINLVGPNLDRLVAKQMRAEPIFSVEPTRNEIWVRLAARAARDLVRYVYGRRKMRSGRRMLFVYRNVTGNGFVKVLYNPMLGAVAEQNVPCSGCNGTGQMQLPPDIMALVAQAQAVGMPLPPELSNVMASPCPACQGAGQVSMGRKAIGDVDMTVVPPWEIWPRKGARCVEDGCFHARQMSKEVASAQYGLSPEEIAGSEWFEHQNEPEFSRLARARRISGGQQEPDTVWVIERWLPPLPNRKAPRLTVMVGNRIIFPRPESPDFARGWSEIAEQYGRIPIFHFRYRPSAENFWSHGIVKDIISSNDYVNRSRQNTHRHHDVMAAGKWLVEKGSVDKDAINKEIGEVVEYTPLAGERPHIVSPVGLPEWLFRAEQNEEQRIATQMGLAEIDRGVAPPNVEATSALNFLAEQADTIHRPVFDDDADQWTGVAECIVVCAITNYKPADARLRRISGKGSALEVEALLQADVVDGLDIKASIGTAAVHSLALRQQMVMDAAREGLIGKDEFKTLMEWGALMGEDDDDRRLQESTAHMENLMIEKSGGMAQPDPMTGMVMVPGHTMLHTSHNHLVHYLVHRRAALEAQLDGNQQLAAALEAAAAEHFTVMQPPAPPPEAAAPPPA